MLRRLIVLAGLTAGMCAAVVIAVAPPALAKGPTLVRITGPGLAHQIVISGGGDLPHHLLDLRFQLGEVEIRNRRGRFCENCKLFIRELRETAQHHKSLANLASEGRYNSRAEQRDNRCMAAQHAEITFDARQIGLPDLLRKEHFSAETRLIRNVAIMFSDSWRGLLSANPSLTSCCE